MDLKRIKNILESLLFVTKRPLTLKELSNIIEVPEEKVEEALQALSRDLEEDSGLRLIKVAHGYIQGTNPENSPYVDRLVTSKVETTLSPQSLETLAIIAYKQPITKPELERIRGVYCDGVLETLIYKKLIEEKGRSEGVGRPILYGTTTEFLRHFGLKDLKDLPPLPENLQEQEDLFKTALHEA